MWPNRKGSLAVCAKSDLASGKTWPAGNIELALNICRRESPSVVKAFRPSVRFAIYSSLGPFERLRAPVRLLGTQASVH